CRRRRAGPGGGHRREAGAGQAGREAQGLSRLAVKAVIAAGEAVNDNSIKSITLLRTKTKGSSKGLKSHRCPQGIFIKYAFLLEIGDGILNRIHNFIPFRALFLRQHYFTVDYFFLFRGHCFHYYHALCRGISSNFV
ncbi:MAG: hypothetical protein Q6373_001795, partial [Candidatus Sigynarchaeota archaeon]